jgi:hypothetical protein
MLGLGIQEGGGTRFLARTDYLRIIAASGSGKPIIERTALPLLIGLISPWRARNAPLAEKDGAMLRKLIATPLLALAVLAAMFAPAESRGGFHGGFGGFRAGGLGGSFHRGFGGFHPGFGGGLRHRFAGSFHHRARGPGWPWWGYWAGALAYANSYYPYYNGYSPNYEDALLDANDVNSYYAMPYPYYDGGYWQRGRSWKSYGRSDGDLGEGWRTCPIRQVGSCVITIP